MSTRERANDLVAQELRAELARQRLSMADLARKMDVEQSWLHKRLTGVIPLRIGEVMDIADLLKIPLERIIERVRSAKDATTRVYSRSASGLHFRPFRTAI